MVSGLSLTGSASVPPDDQSEWRLNADIPGAAGVGRASARVVAGDDAAVTDGVGSTYPNGGMIVAERSGALDAFDEDGNSWHRLFPGTRAMDPAWSPDGRRLVFQSGDGEVVVADPFGEGRQVLTDTTIYERTPTWSPDGTKIAFTRDEAIWVMDADGTDQHQVTTECCNGSPAWSPDGTKIAFESYRSGQWQIYVLDLSTGEPAVQLTEASGANRWPAWSPDGQKIVFTTGRRQNNSDLWLMDPDGSNEAALIEGAGGEKFAQWSPDGQRIVYADGVDIAVVNRDGTGRRVLASGDTPDWQPLPACTVTGTDGPDELHGTPSADVLCGGGGDDRLVDGAGDDILLGQDGSDTLASDATGSGVQADLQTGLISGQGADFALGVENVAGTDNADSLRGNETANQLIGGPGDDTLAGADGVDQLQGGGGIDQVVGTDPVRGMDLDIAAGTLGEWNQVDAVSGVENALGLAGASDFLRGDDGPNVLDGGGTDVDVADTFQGRGGDDRLIGGGGALYGDAPSAVTVNIRLGTADGDGHDTLVGISNAQGSDFDDHLIAGQLPLLSTLTGGQGDDLITTGLDHGSLYGGTGNDTVDYANAAGGVTVDLAAGVQSAPVYAGEVVEFENVRGTPFADVLTGTDQGNRLAGGAGPDRLLAGTGADVLEAGAGADVVELGAGDDTVHGGLGIDRLTFNTAVRGVVVSLAESYALGQGSDAVDGIEDVTGSDYPDTIRGSHGPNELGGRASNDEIFGLSGDDNLIAGPGRDSLSGGGGADRLAARDGEPDLVDGGIGRDTCILDRYDQSSRCP
jgi:Ca2+-binding RTX toxin-like protein